MSIVFQIIIHSFFTTAVLHTKSNRGNKTVLGMMHAFIPCLGTQINLNFRGRHEKKFHKQRESQKYCCILLVMIINS